MLVQRLNAKHPSWNGDLWCDYEALYRGGHCFRERIDRFLNKANEPWDIYQEKKREAVYRSYAGTIVRFFSALMFTSPLTYTATPEGSDEPKAVDWLQEFEEDCDGNGTDFKEFVR